jgi:hypothetical protein
MDWWQTAADIAASGGTGGRTRPPTRVTWTLVHHASGRYVLTNEGDATARDVMISAHESLPIGDLPPVQDVQPHRVLSFLAARTTGTGESTITVTWTDGQARTWKCTLPPS